jgi:hypothetical protein
MSEQILQTPKMPSGYESSMTLPEQALIDQEVLPWLDGPVPITVGEFRLQTGEEFKLASVIGTHPKLVEAAEGMTENQKRHTDSMFYARIPTVVSQGYSPNVETLPQPATDFPIYVMRNNAGQRVYFARTRIDLDKGEVEPVVLRLAACDKNRQSLVMDVLSAASSRQRQRKMSK